jgi:MFS family permease
VRYLLYSSDVAGLLLLGVALHGCAYTFIFISAQIYLSQQVPKEWQTRAQALLTLMHAGLGSLAGYILTGTWYRYCEVDGTVAWQKFWLALAAVVGGVLVFFWINAQAMDESKSKSET